MEIGRLQLECGRVADFGRACRDHALHDQKHRQQTHSPSHSQRSRGEQAGRRKQAWRGKVGAVEWRLPRFGVALRTLALWSLGACGTGETWAIGRAAPLLSAADLI
jgi:hypothetical protein